MKLFLKNTAVIKAEDEAVYKMTLRYYVTMDNIAGIPPLFGVRIVKSCDLPECTGSEEESEIRQVFSSRTDAEAFLELLFRCTVTPISLDVIAEEYISEKLLAA